LLFVFHDDGAESVALAGDFNGWDPLATPLERNGAGLWSKEVLAPSSGQFEYKFIVNGNRWVEDPSNGMKAPDSYGGLNSVIVLTTNYTDISDLQ
jgi:1,4-alpha-glucan branching enzyme